MYFSEDFLTEDYAGAVDEIYNLGVEEEDILLADDDHLHHENFKQASQENGSVFVEKQLITANGPKYIDEVHIEPDFHQVHEPIQRKHSINEPPLRKPSVHEPIHLQLSHEVTIILCIFYK